MIKPDHRQRIRRINQLQAAADVIEALRTERPELVALYVNHDIVLQLRTLAGQYEAKPFPPPVVTPLRAKHQKKAVTVLHFDEPRKPPQRVAMSRRRPTIVPKKTAPIHFLEMSSQELVEVGKRALAEQGKSPNHRKLKLGSKMREVPIAQREHDDEAAHEEGQTFGHDVPDGSD